MTPTPETLRKLLDLGRLLVTELDPDTVLDRILEAARETTGARYVALGVLTEDRTALSRFVWLGMDDEDVQRIGTFPLGRGVLGELVEQPVPLRLEEVSRHPSFYGFPAGHPPMHTFLGVPILIRGSSWGNLYLTAKLGGTPFTAEDEEAAVVLASWAAVAVENARLYSASERRRAQLERAVHGLEVAQEIAEAIGDVSALERILQLIVTRARTLIGARSVLISLRDDEDLVLVASDGADPDALGMRFPIASSTSGEVLLDGRPRRVTDVDRLRISPAQVGVHGARTAMLVPMIHDGAGVGLIIAFDRGEEANPFSTTDEQALRALAASGANAVAIARTVEADRLRSAVAAGERERARWARELHDETLQALAGLRMTLSGALREQPEQRPELIRTGIADVEEAIDNLRAIIADLRPAVLDDLGLSPALEALIDRRIREGGLRIDSHLRLPPTGVRAVSPELETTIYRVVQEALTNVVRHARATLAQVLVEHAGDDVVIEVIDDGRGFDPDATVSGFGLAGMRERVYLAGGVIAVESGSAGTRVRVRLPAGEHRGSVADQLVP